MSDTKSGDDKTLSVTPKKTLTLKRPGIEQSDRAPELLAWPHQVGRQVETKKRKFSMPGDKPEPVRCTRVFTPKPAVAASARGAGSAQGAAACRRRSNAAAWC